MAGSAQHLTVGELEERFRAATDVVARSHCQAIWLLAKGHSTAEVAEIVALSPRWINKLARGYAAEGADALGGEPCHAIGPSDNGERAAAIPAPGRCSRRPISRRCGSG